MSKRKLPVVHLLLVDSPRHPRFKCLFGIVVSDNLFAYIIIFLNILLGKKKLKGKLFFKKVLLN